MKSPTSFRRGSWRSIRNTQRRFAPDAYVACRLKSSAWASSSRKWSEAAQAGCRSSSSCRCIPDFGRLSMIRLVSWDVDGTLFSYSRLLIALLRLSPRKLETCGWIEMAAQIRHVCRFHQAVEAQRRCNGSRVDTGELRSFESIQVAEKAALDAALQIAAPRTTALDLLKVFRTEGVPQVTLSDFECDYKLKA